jgi:biopolymer transport protein ExbD
MVRFGLACVIAVIAIAPFEGLGAEPTQWAVYKLPGYNYDANGIPEPQPASVYISVSAKGQIFQLGAPLERAAFLRLIENMAAHADDKFRAAFTLNPNLPAKAAYQLIRDMNEARFTRYGFKGFEQYSAFKKGIKPTPFSVPRADGAAASSDPTNPDLYVTSVDSAGREPGMANYAGASPTGKCRVYWKAKPVNSDEFVELALQHLIAIIDANGGPNTPELPDLETEVLIDSNASIRCLAGVIYGSALSGHTVVRIALAP